MPPTVPASSSHRGRSTPRAVPRSLPGVDRDSSPDFNPIEMAFSKLKALLRKAAERTIPALWDAIGRLIDLVTPAEAANYFAAAGYDPT